MQGVPEGEIDDSVLDPFYVFAVQQLAGGEGNLDGVVIAVEEMEGTDATISRAGELFRTLDSGGETTLRRALTVVKVAKPNQDMRFDVPVVGVATIEAMKAAGATCLAVEAERTLMFDPAAILNTADAAGISIVAK